jgi:DNA-binding MarR family transcriptional regulator
MHAPVDVEQQVIAALRRITRAIDLHSRLLLQKHGLSSPQLAALQVIQRMQPICAGTLARELRLSYGTVSGILGRLEKRLLIHRMRGAQDRRSVLVELTDTGAKVIEEAPSLLQDRFRWELSRLQQWERTTILATLQRIAAMMEPERIQAVPVLVAGAGSAGEEDVSRYVAGAVLAGDGALLADEVAPSASARDAEGLSREYGNRPAMPGV